MGGSRRRAAPRPDPHRPARQTRQSGPSGHGRGRSRSDAFRTHADRRRAYRRGRRSAGLHLPVAEYGRQAAGRHPRADHLRLRRGELGQKARRTGRRRRRDGDLPPQGTSGGFRPADFRLHPALGQGAYSDPQPPGRSHGLGAHGRRLSPCDGRAAAQAADRPLRPHRQGAERAYRVPERGRKTADPGLRRGVRGDRPELRLRTGDAGTGAKGDLVVRFDPAKAPQPLRRTPLPVGGPDVPPSRRMLWIEFGETE